VFSLETVVFVWHLDRFWKFLEQSRCYNLEINDARYVTSEGTWV